MKPDTKPVKKDTKPVYFIKSHLDIRTTGTRPNGIKVTRLG